MDMDIEKLALMKAVGGSGGGGGGSSVLVALTATDNDTTYDPADYNADGFSSVSVEIAVPQVFVAQKQVSGNRVIYDFGRSVEECAIGPILGEFSKTGGGMSLSFGNPRVYDGNGSYDQGSFNGHSFQFTSSVVSTGEYPSRLVAVTPE